MDVRRLLRSSTYLNCADLGGESVTVTISNVAEETVGIGSSSEQKAVVYFQGAEDKSLVLNKTNGNTIVDLLGFDTETWTGKEIMLYPAKTFFGGKEVDCIRVRMPQTTQATSINPTTKPNTDEIPF